MSERTYYYAINAAVTASRDDLTPLEFATLALEDMKFKLEQMTPREVLDVLDYDEEEGND